MAANEPNLTQILAGIGAVALIGTKVCSGGMADDWGREVPIHYQAFEQDSDDSVDTPTNTDSAKKEAKSEEKAAVPTSGINFTPYDITGNLHEAPEVLEVLGNQNDYNTLCYTANLAPLTKKNDGMSQLQRLARFKPITDFQEEFYKLPGENALLALMGTETETGVILAKSYGSDRIFGAFQQWDRTANGWGLHAPNQRVQLSLAQCADEEGISRGDYQNDSDLMHKMWSCMSEIDDRAHPIKAGDAAARSIKHKNNKAKRYLDTHANGTGLTGHTELELTAMQYRWPAVFKKKKASQRDLNYASRFNEKYDMVNNQESWDAAIADFEERNDATWDEYMTSCEDVANNLGFEEYKCALTGEAQYCDPLKPQQSTEQAVEDGKAPQITYESMKAFGHTILDKVKEAQEKHRQEEFNDAKEKMTAAYEDCGSCKAVYGLIDSVF